MAMKKGTNKSETLKGTNGDDVLLGRGGDDTLVGGDGNDRLDGGKGADELIGGDGNDLLLPGQADGADAIDGGKGIDTLSYANFSTAIGVTVDIYKIGQFSFDDAAGDTFFNVERFIGSNGSDSFYINRPEAGLKPYVFGGRGDDTIHTFGGVMRGGEGEDYLLGDSSELHVETFWLELGGGADQIGNFTEDQDKIRVSGKEFGIGSALNSDELVVRQSDANAVGTKAQFIFRNDMDQLYFDSDGAGSEAAILIADFTDSSPISYLTVEDFQIV